MVNYYGILETHQNSSEDDIKKAYKNLALKWHPERNPEKKEEAVRKFKELSEAYEVLSDPNKRILYDTCADDKQDTDSDESDQSFIEFSFRSPEEVFRAVFGDCNPLTVFLEDSNDDSEIQSKHHHEVDSCRRNRPSLLGFGGFPAFGSAFSGSITGFISFTSTSKEESGSQNDTRSMRVSVEMINGKRITTKRILDNGQEKVEVDENGLLESVTINGEEQL
ncbi:dnaJ homolog subfamily B member 6-B-like [Erpetoichthys calabaricus]|uniref:dnaJ homolog subfamily B member 6-B-like n=1 Tax=Erpetoichthys calabaricus TaxID=27687 RepID=UPI002234E79C|nr:dnaJ homolog subfamily B member 6-B-like [Erpetoichthys calabaricus]